MGRQRARKKVYEFIYWWQLYNLIIIKELLSKKGANYSQTRKNNSRNSKRAKKKITKIAQKEQKNVALYGVKPPKYRPHSAPITLNNKTNGQNLARRSLTSNMCKISPIHFGWCEASINFRSANSGNNKICATNYFPTQNCHIELYMCRASLRSQPNRLVSN